MEMEFLRKLPTPQDVKEEFPLSIEIEQIKEKRDRNLRDIFEGKERHPYTVGLFNSIPDLTRKTKRLSPIEGLMPDPSNLPTGCAFHERCPHCMEICVSAKPCPMVRDTHMVRCHLLSQNGEGMDR